MSSCFVCLDKSCTKICPTCECYAHAKCWGEYLKSSTKVRTYFLPGRIIVSTPYATRCPQCRGRILNVKPVTRSDTDLGRRVAVVVDYAGLLSAFEEAETKEEEIFFLTTAFDMLIANKAIVCRNDLFMNMLKARLRSLYEENGWIAANLYHRQFFGTQLVDS